MNIKDFIKQKENQKPVKKSVELDGQTIDFWVRQESAYDQITMLENSGSLMTAVMKMQKAKEDGTDFKPTGEEAASMRKHRARQAQFLMCDENGLPLFASLDDFLKTFDPDQIDKISEVIEKVDTVDEAEKN